VNNRFSSCSIQASMKMKILCFWIQSTFLIQDT
jgi:hypothetical protein